MSVTAVPSPSRRGTRGVVVLALGLGLSGCGVRVETPPPPLPSPDAAEVARQAAAQRTTAIAGDAASALARAGDETLQARLTAVVAEATAHAEALGGIWAPPGWAEAPGEAENGADGSGDTAGEGEADATPPPPAATPTADPATVLDAIATSATLTCTDAVAVGPADLATLLASICLAQDAEARDLAAALGAPEPPSAAEAVVTAAEASSPESAAPGTTPEASLEAVVAATDGGLDLAAALDAAAYGLEIAAARSGGAERDGLADRAAEQRAISQAIVASAGALGTNEDPRRAAYDLGPGGDPGADPAAQASAIEADLLAAWTAVIGDVAPEARPLVLAQMIDAQAATRAGGAPSSTFPGLPELSG